MGVNVGQAATVNLNSAVLSGGASLIANDGRIMFDPNIAGRDGDFHDPVYSGYAIFDRGKMQLLPFYLATCLSSKI